MPTYDRFCFLQMSISKKTAAHQLHAAEEYCLLDHLGALDIDSPPIYPRLTSIICTIGNDECWDLYFDFFFVLYWSKQGKIFCKCDVVLSYQKRLLKIISLSAQNFQKLFLYLLCHQCNVFPFRLLNLFFLSYYRARF